MCNFKKLFIFFIMTAFASTCFGYEFEQCSDDYCVEKFKAFKKYAKKGHPSAMEALGNFYIFGYGTEKDTSKALRMYKKAAKWDQASAQYKIGLMYVSGMTDDDPDKGIKYLKRAVKNEFYEAAYVLGVIYFEGKIEKQDYDEAKEWLEIAADNQIYKASYLLGQMYETNLIEGEQESQEKAIKLYETAAFKLSAAQERLVALEHPLPPNLEDNIEHILVTPQDLNKFLDEQLTLLKNTPAPKVSTGSRVAGQTCKKIMSCSTLGGEESQRMYNEVQRIVGMSIANQFRLQ